MFDKSLELIKIISDFIPDENAKIKGNSKYYYNRDKDYDSIIEKQKTFLTKYFKNNKLDNIDNIENINNKNNINNIDNNNFNLNKKRNQNNNPNIINYNSNYNMKKILGIIMKMKMKYLEIVLQMILRMKIIKV
jgi:hypothetical protein